jgi:hypothetical protein
MHNPPADEPSAATIRPATAPAVAAATDRRRCPMGLVLFGVLGLGARSAPRWR